jgi:hypothetical protein
VSESENERVRASDDDQELSLKNRRPLRCQKARSIYYGKRRARVSASSIRRGRPKYVGWFGFDCRRRERAARVWIERVCRCQTVVRSSPSSPTV